MRIGGMGTAELLVILAVVLLIFGPKNLPKLGSALGKTVKGLREGMGGAKKEAAAEDATEEPVEVEVEEAEPTKEAPAKTTTKKKTPAEKKSE